MTNNERMYILFFTGDPVLGLPSGYYRKVDRYGTTQPYRTLATRLSYTEYLEVRQRLIDKGAAPEQITYEIMEMQ